MDGQALDLLADGDPIRDEVRAVLAPWRLDELTAAQHSNGYPEHIWQAFRAAVGSRMADPHVVRVALEEVGYARCPLPVHGGLVQPVAAAALLGDAAQAVVVTHLLGGGRFEFVMHGGSGLPGAENVSLKAEQAEGNWRISGTARHLRFADSAGYLLVPARAGRGRLLFAVVPANAPGIRLDVHPTLTGDRLTDVTFDETPVDGVAVLAGDAAGDRRGVDAMDAAQDVGTLAVAAELVGMSARLLTLATERVKSRQAYGAPLAALQAVQLRAADLYLSFHAAREAVTEAADVLGFEEGPLSSPRVLASIAAAKAAATDSALAIAAGAHQLCGGWGLLDEAGLHHFTRAIKAAEGQLGSARFHRAAIAEYLKV